MKNYFYLFCFSFLFLITPDLFSQKWVEMMNDPNANFYDIQKEFNAYWKDKKIEKGKGWRQFKRWEYFMEPRVFPNGYIKNNATWQAYNQIGDDYRLSQDKLAGSRYWAPVGPFTVPANWGGAGRLNCIEFDPKNSNIIYVGAPSGGMWKSVDAGATWNTTTDNLLSIGVSDIAIDYTNTDIIYIATGDGDFNDTYSIGVMKSTDGGKTWKTTGLNTTSGFAVSKLKSISKVVMHPTDHLTLLAATSSGIYKTTNGGDTWTQVISTGNFKDLKFKPGNPDIIYAGSTKTLYMSTNGGNTFVAKSSLKFSSAVQRLTLGVTPAAPEYVYVLAGAYSSGGYGGLYRSIDGGNTFTQQSNSPNILGWSADGSEAGGQASYDLAFAVSPTDKDMVFVGGVNIWKSINGGVNWTLNAFWQPGSKKPYVHADIHMLKFINGSGKDLFACTDGGLFKTTDAGTKWTDKSDGLSIAQLYRMSVSQNKSSFVLTGWQDNGGNLLTNSQWFHVIGGDCMESAIDYTNDNIIYISLYYGRIQRSTDSGMEWNSISDSLNSAESSSWVTPFVLDPVNPKIIYAGFQNIWKTSDKGNHWTKLTNLNSSNTFQSIAVAPSNTKFIYAATANAIYKTSDGGTTWSNISLGLPLNKAVLTNIAVSSSNPSKLWVTFSGYVDTIKVYTSSDAGATWKNYSSGIANIPVNCIVYQKNTSDELYVGTDVGVYVRDASHNSWMPYMYSLPNVIVNKLEIQYNTQKLFAGTYGRGLWSVDLHSVVGINELSDNDIRLKIFPNPAGHNINISVDKNMNDNIDMSIYNMVGKRVYSEKLSNPDNISVNISDLPDGIYFVKIFSSKYKFSGNFIKQAE